MSSGPNHVSAFCVEDSFFAEICQTIGEELASETADENINRYEILANEWEEYVNTDDFSELSRLYYYLLPGTGGNGLEDIARSFMFDPRRGFVDSPIQVLGSVFDGRYLYLLFKASRSEKQSVCSIAVLRPHTDLVTVRAPNTDDASATYDLIETIVETPENDRRQNSERRPSFGKSFHNTFEQQIVDRYKRIWIAFRDEAREDILDKVQFIAEGKKNAKESDRVESVLELDGTRMYGGKVSGSGLELSSPTDLFFNWTDKRITFQRRPDEQTKLEITDSIVRVRDLTLTLPVDRILQGTTNPVRVEFYDECYASTWSSNFSLDEFSRLSERVGISDESEAIVYPEEGSVEITTFNELSDSKIERAEFIRINGEELDITGERLSDSTYGVEESTMLGIVTESADADPLQEVYEEVEGTTLDSTSSMVINDILTINSQPEVRD